MLLPIKMAHTEIVGQVTRVASQMCAQLLAAIQALQYQQQDLESYVFILCQQ